MGWTWRFKNNYYNNPYHFHKRHSSSEYDSLCRSEAAKKGWAKRKGLLYTGAYEGLIYKTHRTSPRSYESVGLLVEEQIWVNGYYRRDGVYVPGHYKTVKKRI